VVALMSNVVGSRLPRRVEWAVQGSNLQPCAQEPRCCWSSSTKDAYASAARLTRCYSSGRRLGASAARELVDSTRCGSGRKRSWVQP